MVAAICLVGINAICSGGCCSQAVLQNWSMLVSPQSGRTGPVGRQRVQAGHGDGAQQSTRYHLP